MQHSILTAQTLQKRKGGKKESQREGKQGGNEKKKKGEGRKQERENQEKKVQEFKKFKCVSTGVGQGCFYCV